MMRHIGTSAALLEASAKQGRAPARAARIPPSRPSPTPPPAPPRSPPAPPSPPRPRPTPQVPPPRGRRPRRSSPGQTHERWELELGYDESKVGTCFSVLHHHAARNHRLRLRRRSRAHAGGAGRPARARLHRSSRWRKQPSRWSLTMPAAYTGVWRHGAIVHDKVPCFGGVCSSVVDANLRVMRLLTQASMSASL